MKKLLFLLWIVPCLLYGQGKTISIDANMKIFNGQQSTYYLDTSSLTQAKSGQLSLNGLTIFGDKINADYTEATNAANETRYYDFLVDVQADPANKAEISAGYFRANKTAGSNGEYIINGLEGAVGSSYADEAGTFRGVYGRTYTSAGATATMRTAIGGEFSARAGYNTGTDCVAENGTAFVGARIWMAPYFTSGSLSNINNFHGLWLYNEHTSNTVTNAIFVDDAGSTGGWTNGINFNGATIGTAEIVFSQGEYIENITTDGELHISASIEPNTDKGHDIGGPGNYWHGVYTDDLYVSDSANIDTVVVNNLLHVSDSVYVLGKSMFDSTVTIGEWGYSLNHIIIPESSSNTNAGLGMYGMVDYSATAGKVFAGTYSRMLAMTTNQTNQSTMVGTESQFRLRDVDIADGVHAGLWAYAEQSGESTLSGGGTFDAISATVESGEHFTVGATEQVTGLTVDASIHASATIDASANYSGIYIKSNGLDWFDGIKITGVDNDLKLHSGNTINNPSADDIIYTGRLGSSYFQSLTDIATLDRQHILSGTGKMTGSDPFNGKDQMQGGFFAMQLGEGDAITDARSLYGSESKATLDRDMSDATSNLIGAFNKISVRKTTTFAGTAIANKTILERANTATIAQGYNYYAEKSAVGFTSSAIMGTRADTWDYGIDFNAATFGTSDFRLHNGATILKRLFLRMTLMIILTFLNLELIY